MTKSYTHSIVASLLLLSLGATPMRATAASWLKYGMWTSGIVGCGYLVKKAYNWWQQNLSFSDQDWVIVDWQEVLADSNEYGIIVDPQELCVQARSDLAIIKNRYGRALQIIHQNATTILAGISEDNLVAITDELVKSIGCYDQIKAQVCSDRKFLKDWQNADEKDSWELLVNITMLESIIEQHRLYIQLHALYIQYGWQMGANPQEIQVNNRELLYAFDCALHYKDTKLYKKIEDLYTCLIHSEPV